MHTSYHRDFSRHLGRDMEYKRYGHAGRPVIVFPTSRGRFYQFEDSGAVGALGEFIETGRIQVFTLDGIDDESFFGPGDLTARIGRHESYFAYVREEAYPRIMAQAVSKGRFPSKPIVCGCSMGAFHAANFVFRFPDLCAGLIALSGVYSTRDFFGEVLEGQIYFNSPLDYLAGLTDSGALARLRALRLIFCCGQGRWEERMIAETRQLERLLEEKQIPAWVDFWGTDVDHDWPWWHRQFVYFFGHWLDEEQKKKRA